MKIGSNVTAWGWIAVVAGLALMPTGCGSRDRLVSGSETKAIATDLPDDGTNGKIHLYWIFAGNILRGECRLRNPGDPLIPRTCMRNDSTTKSMSYEVFKEKLDNGLSQTIKNLSEEARNIQQAIARINAQIIPIKVEIERLEREGNVHSAELARLRNDLSEFQIYVSELQDQLRYIEEELRRTANDPDLLAQRSIVMEQLGRFRTKLNDISGRIPALLDKVRSISAQVDVLKTQLVALTTRLNNLQIDLDDVTTRLAVAYDDFSVYEDTLRRLESQAIFSALSTNTIVQRQRQFIKRFDRIFTSPN